MATVCTNETQKAKAAQRHEAIGVLAEILGQHSEEFLPLLGREAA